MRIKYLFISIIILLFATGCSDNENNLDKLYKLEKDGIKLNITLDKPSYTLKDTISVTATVKNTTKEDYFYTVNSSCDKGFIFKYNNTFNRLLTVESAKVDGENLIGVACAMAMGSSSISPDKEIKLVLTFKVRENVEDKTLYKRERATATIIFEDLHATIDIPVDFKKSNNPIPAKYKEAEEGVR